MKLKTIPLAIALTLTCAVVVRANPSISWERSAEIAFDAAENGDWDTTIINLNRAIENNPDECLNGYYREFLLVAQEAKNLVKEGASEASVYQLYHTRTAEIYEDCVAYWATGTNESDRVASERFSPHRWSL